MEQAGIDLIVASFHPDSALGRYGSQRPDTRVTDTAAKEVTLIILIDAIATHGVILEKSEVVEEIQFVTTAVGLNEPGLLRRRRVRIDEVQVLAVCSPPFGRIDRAAQTALPGGGFDPSHANH